MQIEFPLYSLLYYVAFGTGGIIGTVLVFLWFVWAGKLIWNWVAQKTTLLTVMMKILVTGIFLGLVNTAFHIYHPRLTPIHSNPARTQYLHDLATPGEIKKTEPEHERIKKGLTPGDKDLDKAIDDFRKSVGE